MKITLLHKTVNAREAGFEFAVDSELEPYFRELRTLRVVVHGGEIDVAHASDFFFVAIAPLAWILGAEIESQEQVSHSGRLTIDAVGSYLANHYRWRGRLALQNLRTVIRRPALTSRRALMFSGGVDSLAALINVGVEVDTLIHLLNFDRLFSDISTQQHELDLSDMQEMAVGQGKRLVTIETNIADILRHGRFDRFFPGRCSFWYGLQHVNHAAAAISVLSEFEEIFLSGSFDKLHEQVGSCAARSQFVERYTPHAGLRLVQEHMLRQAKIEMILDRNPALLSRLRVCYSSGDRTCTRCEKCLGTAMMVVAGGGSLASTSFPPGTEAALAARLRELRDAPVNHSLLTEQALNGRTLGGTRAQRFARLEALLA